MPVNAADSEGRENAQTDIFGILSEAKYDGAYGTQNHNKSIESSSMSSPSINQRSGRFAIGIADNQPCFQGQDLFEEESDSESFSVISLKKQSQSNIHANREKSLGTIK